MDAWKGGFAFLCCGSFFCGIGHPLLVAMLSTVALDSWSVG